MRRSGKSYEKNFKLTHLVRILSEWEFKYKGFVFGGKVDQSAESKNKINQKKNKNGKKSFLGRNVLKREENKIFILICFSLD